MRRLRYLAQAFDDFADIAEWLAEQGAPDSVAEKFLDSLDQRCVRMAENPALLGRVRDDLGIELRSLAFRGYLIFFRYSDEHLEIVRVVHGARDLLALFAEMDD